MTSSELTTKHFIEDIVHSFETVFQGTHEVNLSPSLVPGRKKLSSRVESVYFILTE